MAKDCVVKESAERLHKAVKYVEENPHLISAYAICYFSLDGEFKMFADGYISEIVLGVKCIERNMVRRAVGAKSDEEFEEIDFGDDIDAEDD